MFTELLKRLRRRSRPTKNTANTKASVPLDVAQSRVRMLKAPLGAAVKTLLGRSEASPPPSSSSRDTSVKSGMSENPFESVCIV